MGISIVAVVFPFCKSSYQINLTRWWSQKLLRLFNLHVITSGNLPNSLTKSTMLVANHISWADIHAINSILPVRFIAKMEIKDWPVFGYLVRKSGTVFIDRNQRKDATRIVSIAAECLSNGDNMCFFPEGTTTEGVDVLPFKSSILQATIDAHATIIPIAIRYPTESGGINIEAAYAGDTSIMSSMLTILKAKKTIVELHFLEPIKHGTYSNRQQLAQLAHQAIKTRLGLG